MRRRGGAIANPRGPRSGWVLAPRPTGFFNTEERGGRGDHGDQGWIAGAGPLSNSVREHFPRDDGLSLAGRPVRVSREAPSFFSAISRHGIRSRRARYRED